MEFNEIVKFNNVVKIEGADVVDIYGDYNKTTGHLSYYVNPINIELIKNNKEEVQKQVESFKTEIKNKMLGDTLFIL